ncbi:hypothetical protein CASFOL_034954 [Castilleja foliolosa]|uniref:Uncharacterized protein n=1 Tax=Castilleja foliolosa TaxID=1961234 RepID=A0ABD3BTK4_9LAMI
MEHRTTRAESSQAFIRWLIRSNEPPNENEQTAIRNKTPFLLHTPSFQTLHPKITPFHHLHNFENPSKDHSQTSRATHCCKFRRGKHPQTPYNYPSFKLCHTHKVFDKLPQPSFQAFHLQFRTMPPRNNRRQGTRRQRGDISHQHGVPFPVFNEEEVEIFKSLENRHVTKLKWFDLNDYEEDARLNRRFGSVITGYMNNLNAGVLARNKRPGFKSIMLEFITTFKIGVTGNMTYRLNGEELELKEDEVTRLLGIDGHGREGPHDEDYDLGTFWNYLTGGRPGNYSRLQASRIHDDEVYVAYKFIAHVILNKDESSVISKAELYALWCMTNGKSVRLVPLITASLEYIIKSRTKQAPAYLAFGGLITMIARHHEIDLDDDQADYPSEEFAVTGRKVGNVWRTIPQNREEELPDADDDDDDDNEVEDEDAFDDGARPRRRRLTNEPAYMEVDEDDVDYEEEEEDEDEEDVARGASRGWRGAEARLNQRFDAWTGEFRVYQEEARSRHEELIRRDDEARERQEVKHKELMDALARWNTGGQQGPPPL